MKSPENMLGIWFIREGQGVGGGWGEKGKGCLLTECIEMRRLILWDDLGECLMGWVWDVLLCFESILGGVFFPWHVSHLLRGRSIFWARALRKRIDGIILTVLFCIGCVVCGLLRREWIVRFVCLDWVGKYDEISRWLFFYGSGWVYRNCSLLVFSIVSIPLSSSLTTGSTFHGLPTFFSS